MSRVNTNLGGKAANAASDVTAAAGSKVKSGAAQVDSAVTGEQAKHSISQLGADTAAKVKSGAAKVGAALKGALPADRKI